MQAAFVKSRSRCCRPVKAQPHVCEFRLGSGLDWMPVNVAPFFILFRGDGTTEVEVNDNAFDDRYRSMRNIRYRHSLMGIASLLLC